MVLLTSLDAKILFIIYSLLFHAYTSVLIYIKCIHKRIKINNIAGSH